ncbi:hypothetical protein LXL04_001397 [Taraxacum kok-saghyz]
MVYNNLQIDLNSDFADDNDTTLRLECSGYGGRDISLANPKQQNKQDSKSAPKDGNALVVGFGPTPTTYSNDHSSSVINRNKKQTDEDSILELSLSHYSTTSKSDLNPNSNYYSGSFETSNKFGIHVFDEGSVSSKKSGGYMPSLLLAPRFEGLLQYEPSESSIVSDFSTESSIGHGGRRRCNHPTGCSNAARGKWEFCIKHGGGKRCVVDGCDRSAELQLGLCISHGGGKRCCFLGCTNGAQGRTNYCKSHGGGKRCVFSGCTTGAEGSTQLCKSHGGGKRCLYEGGGICPKSVHGGTKFCVNHGGGKRCVVPGCTSSARGRTHCCVKHGGGKRCRFENCTKGAQGSTDYCKGHGGGRRCGWEGEVKCEKFARGKGGLCVVHGTMVKENEKSGIGPRLFYGVVAQSASDNNSLSDVSYISRNSIGLIERPAKRRQLIPPHVLVPSSMKPWVFPSFTFDHKEGGGSEKTGTASGIVVPEGRVHGGSLLALLKGNLRDAVIDGI